MTQKLALKVTDVLTHPGNRCPDIRQLLTMFFTVGAVYKTPPLNYILAFNDAIKEYWIKGPEYEPPIQHGELLPLSSFLKKVDIGLESALRLLQQNNITVTGPDQKLGAIAARNRTSPAEIYKLLKTAEKTAAQTAGLLPLRPPAQPVSKPQPASTAAVKRWTSELIQSRFEGKGIGRKTLAEICTEFKLDQAVVTRKLATKKITMAPGDSLKETGAKHNEAPLEIMTIILAGEEVKE